MKIQTTAVEIRALQNHDGPVLVLGVRVQAEADTDICVRVGGRHLEASRVGLDGAGSAASQRDVSRGSHDELAGLGLEPRRGASDVAAALPVVGETAIEIVADHGSLLLDASLFPLFFCDERLLQSASAWLTTRCSTSFKASSEAERAAHLSS